MRILSNVDVAALLPPQAAFQVVAEAMRAVSAGGAEMPLRSAVPLGGGNAMGVMPGAFTGALSGLGFGVKLVSLFPGNPARGLSGHRGAVILFESETGAPVAMMDAGLLTAIRTASASAVAAQALARPDSTTLCLIGTGEQARHHLLAFAGGFALSAVRVVGRTPQRAAEFCAAMAGQVPGVELVPVGEVVTGVRGADLVVTVTNSATPILTGDQLEPGQHLSIVGASVATKREVDAALVRRASIWVDYRPSALAQAGEIVDLIAQGADPETLIQGEIGQVLSGAIAGRQSADQITAYRSLGVIAQDLACAAHVLEQAEAEGRGTLVTLE